MLCIMGLSMNSFNEMFGYSECIYPPKLDTEQQFDGIWKMIVDPNDIS